MRYCPQCGAQPQINARFCTQCGARLPSLNPNSATPQPAPLDTPTVIAPAKPVKISDDTMVFPPTGRPEMSDDATHLAPAPQTYDPLSAPRLSEMFAAHSAPQKTEPRAPRIGEQFAQATAQSPLFEEFAQDAVQSDGDYRGQDDAEQRSAAKFIPILAAGILVILVIIALIVFL